MTKPNAAATILATALVTGCGGSDCPTESGTGCAPDDRRVDLYTPVFSSPTTIDHPLYPVGTLASVVFIGQVDGKPFRTETTLLPTTRFIDIGGGTMVEVLESQYMSFFDGRIEEIALDWFAQDERGSVWYLGEDVADYDDTGEVYTNEGTWRAGADGAPPAMIMPAALRVGDAWLAENAAPIVWEQITISAVDQTFDGPSGPVSGGVIGQELKLDGEREEKLFAPGYGEFSTRALEGDNYEPVALALPTDKLSGPRPAELDTLARRTADLFDAAGGADFAAADTALGAIDTAWAAFRATQVPPRLAAEMDRVLALVHTAVTARSAADARQHTITATRIVFDLCLRHEQPTEIDRVRFDLWLAQVAVDSAAGAPGPVRGDANTLALVWQRIAHTFDAPARAMIEARVGDLRSAAVAGDLAGAAQVADGLRTVFAGMGWRRL